MQSQFCLPHRRIGQFYLLSMAPDARAFIMDDMLAFILLDQLLCIPYIMQALGDECRGGFDAISRLWY